MKWIQIFQELIEAREKQQILRLRKALIEAEDVQLLDEDRMKMTWRDEMRWWRDEMLGMGLEDLYSKK